MGDYVTNAIALHKGLESLCSKLGAVVHHDLLQKAVSTKPLSQDIQCSWDICKWTSLVYTSSRL